MQKQISYGITGCCIGILIGFAVGFPIFFQIPYEKRGTIGLAMMMSIVLGLCVAGGLIGVKKAGPEFPGDDETGF